VKPNKSAKSQALSAIQELQKVLPIERAHMRIRLEVSGKIGKELKAALAPHVYKFEEENFDREAELVILIDPGEYRPVDEVFQKVSKGKGMCEIVDMAVHHDDNDAE